MEIEEYVELKRDGHTYSWRDATGRAGFYSDPALAHLSLLISLIRTVTGRMRCVRAGLKQKPADPVALWEEG